MVTYFKAGDPIKNAHWTILLARKMEALEADLEIATKPQYTNLDYNACLKATDTRYQKRPQVYLGYEWAKLENVYGIVTLLHEIGHVIDYKKCSHSMVRYYKKYGTLEMEVRAWENAFRLAREIGFTDFDLVKEHAYQCLPSYFDIYEKQGYIANDIVTAFTGERPTRAEGMARIDKAYEEAKTAYRRAYMGV